MAEASDSAHHREEVCPQCHEIHQSTNRTSSAQPQDLQWSKSPRSSGFESQSGEEPVFLRLRAKGEEAHPFEEWRSVAVVADDRVLRLDMPPAGER